jgi:hypothetical protein
MALPTSGSISMDDIKAELGITGELSLTDQRVRDLVGIQSGSITMPNDFYGKSARTVRLIITGYEQVQMGFGGWNQQQYDKITFGISVSPYLAPSSYSWGNDVYGNSATAVFMGPAYQVMGYTYQNSGTAYCSVVVGGRTYDLTLDFQYTAGDAI